MTPCPSPRAFGRRGLAALFVALAPVIVGASPIDLDPFDAEGPLAPGFEIGPPAGSFGTAASPTLAAALRALSSGEFDAAEAAARRETEARPDGADGWHALGVALAHLDRPQEAVAALDRAAMLYDRNAEPLVLKAGLLHAMGRRDEALAAFRAGAARDPTNWRAWEGAAILLEEAGDPTAADAYAAAIEADPDRLFPRLRLAQLRVASGDFAAALGTIEPFVEAHPEDAQAVVALGYLNRAGGEPRAAAESFARAAALLPPNAGLAVLQARAEREAGDAAAALRTLREAEAALPGDPDVLLELGTLLGATGAYDQAAEAFGAGLEARPDDPRLLRGARLARMRLGELEAAADTARLLAARADATADDLFWLGFLEEQRGDPAAAAAAYEAALVADEDAWMAANNLAALLATTDPTRALALAQQASEAAPDDPNVADTLAWAQLKAGQADEAAAAYAALTRQRPDDATLAYRHGLALIETGAIEAGRDEVARALELDPGFREADEARARLAGPGP